MIVIITRESLEPSRAARAFRIIFDRTQGTLEYQRLFRKKATGSYYFVVLANLMVSGAD